MKELEVKDLGKKFGTHTVLEHVDQTMHSGEIVGIIGPNGSGKSVYLKMLAGLLAPSSGKIMLNGKKLKKSDFSKANIGACIEKPEFLSSMSGLENLSWLAGFRGEINKKQILKWMDMFDLKDAANERVSDYSLGMKQKLGIIQAVMENQNIILLDEVSNSLDQKSKKILIDLLQQLKQDNRIIVYVNHDIHEVKEVSDEIYEIEDRRLVKCS